MKKDEIEKVARAVAKKDTQKDALKKIEKAGKLPASEIHHKTVEGLTNLGLVEDVLVKHEGEKVDGLKLSADGKKVAAALKAAA